MYTRVDTDTDRKTQSSQEAGEKKRPRNERGRWKEEVRQERYALSLQFIFLTLSLG